VANDRNISALVQVLGGAGPKRVAARPQLRERVRLRAAIATMTVTFVLTILFLMAYLRIGCQLGDPIT
jgi:hypothetical protein